MRAKRTRPAALVLIFGAAVAFAACGTESSSGQPDPGRCPTCGMVVSPESGWRAGAEGLLFDGPKCLFRHRHRGHEVRDAWMIEYYSQERHPAAELLYVIGADLESPMGRDLVPVAGREAAERLMEDHHGERILAFDEVSAAVVEELFRPRP